MVVLGLLLMLACAALAADAVVQNTHVVDAVAFDQTIAGLSLGTMFVAGAVLGLLFALGLVVFIGGPGRAARVRRERRALRRDTADTESLRAENERLERQLAAERSNSTYPTEPAGTDTTTATGTTATGTTGRHRVGG